MLYFFLAVLSLNSACLIHEIPWARPKIEEMANRYVKIASQFVTALQLMFIQERHRTP